MPPRGPPSRAAIRPVAHPIPLAPPVWSRSPGRRGARAATAPAGAGLGAFIFSSLLVFSSFLVRAFRAPAAAQVPSVSGLNSCSTSSLEVIRPCCRVYSRNFDKVASLDLMP